MQPVLGVNTIDAMCCIEILHNDDLETSRRALPRSDRGVGQEDLPYLKEKVSVSFEACLNRCKLHGHNSPDNDQDWKCSENGKEKGRLEAPAELPRKPLGDTHKYGAEDEVRPLFVPRTFGWKRRIVYGGGLFTRIVSRSQRRLQD